MASLIPWRAKRGPRDQGEVAPLNRLQSEMDRLFDTFFREPLSGVQWPWRERGTWMPTVDVSETENEVTVRAELPGIDPQDLDVSILGNQLMLSGEKKESTEQKQKGYYHSETRYGSFRTIPLPQGVDTGEVEAKYENGVLTLSMKKLPEAVPKKIEVKAHD
jgi:HSP20 family protein